MIPEINKSNNFPLVSIVIPTLNRRTQLRNCLNSLLEINYSNFEVVVVDNGCTDDTEEMVRRDFSNVNFIFEKKKGVVFARNAGSKFAKGEIIAYTDDDCIVDPNWISELVSGFSSPKIGAVGGPVFHLHPELIPEKFWCSRSKPLNLGKKRLFQERMRV